MVRAIIQGDLAIIRGESIEEIERELNQPPAFPPPTREELDQKLKELSEIWEKNKKLESESEQ